jgi:hypothetical protein
MGKVNVQKLIEQGYTEDEIDILLAQAAIRDKYKRTTRKELRRIMREKDRKGKEE